MNDVNLRPCPFCGGKPFYTYDANAENFRYVRCSGCQVRTAPVFAGIDDSGQDHAQRAYMKSADTWNRRLPMADEIVFILTEARKVALARHGGSNDD